MFLGIVRQHFLLLKNKNKHFFSGAMTNNVKKISMD